MADGDLEELNLDVYDTKNGLWCPEHGDLERPVGWEFPAAGDNFVTRRVKASGVYWTLWRPRGRHGGHRRKIGVLAPAATVDAARAEPVATAERRAARRAVNTSARQRAEDRYRVELAAVRSWLDFAPEHADLAAEIADGVAEHGAVVGSGRWEESTRCVGGTGTVGRQGAHPSSFHRLRGAAWRHRHVDRGAR